MGSISRSRSSGSPSAVIPPDIVNQRGDLSAFLAQASQGGQIGAPAATNFPAAMLMQAITGQQVDPSMFAPTGPSFQPRPQSTEPVTGINMLFNQAQAAQGRNRLSSGKPDLSSFFQSRGPRTFGPESPAPTKKSRGGRS